MKKLLLLLTIFIFACSSDDSNSDSNSNISCTDFNASTSPSDARQAAINYDSNEYNSLVSQYGQPISEGYFTDGNELYYYVFMFDSGTNNGNKICYSVDDECVTYSESAGCFEVDTVDDCDECVGLSDERIN